MENLEYTVKNEPQCVIEMKIEVAQSRVEAEFEKIISHIRKNVSMPGFRKGNVPINIIKERYNSEARQELINRVAPEAISKVIEKENLNPVTTPKITDYTINSGEPLKLSVKIEVYPEIQLKKYKKIKLEKKEYSVDEKDVENTIQSFRENNAVLNTKEGEAGDRDYVVVNLEARFDAKKIDLGLPEEILMEIGGQTVMPGFDGNIMGMKKGDTKEFKYRFPENFHKDELKGKEAQFNVTVKEIKEKNLPDNKEIAESLGHESPEQLSEKIRENLEKRMAKASEDDMENQIIDYLLEKHDFELPAGLIEESVEDSKKKMADYIAGQGGDPDKVDETKIREKVLRELKAGVILAEIAKEENIKVEESDKKSEEDKIVKMLGEDNKANREKAQQFINGNVILTRKVFDLIIKNAKIKKVAASAAK
ncbi:MAG: trigger factor [Elusimicrobiota bacterium]